ncbi:PAS domain S-box protein [Shumkonia mesophila]|uniref:PAS domain S-box protein n=1 Tax=Shumkonia mesophila TaxID=2838854 RepID=UPI002934B567|nr:PAS domain S-box protein [Shumkonia mesophila]
MRESEQRFAKAFLSSPVAMVISHMEDGVVYDVNERWSALSGYTREAALGKTAAELRHWSDLAQRAAFVEQLNRDGAILNFEAQFRTRDGDERTVLVSGEIIAIRGKSRLLLALDDITARKRAEEAVRDSEAKFRSLVEGSIQGISVSRDGKLLFVNPSFAAIFGYADPTEILDLPSTDLLFAPSERERLGVSRERRNRGEAIDDTYEFEGLRKDGTAIWVEYRTTGVEWAGRPAVLSAVVDITEKRTLARQLAHAQKMEGIGQLAAGTAHDFNNLLQVIHANLELIELEVAGNIRASEFLEAASHAVRRGGKLTQYLLSFARQQALSPTIVDVNSRIRESAPVLGRLLGKHIEVSIRLQDGIAAIMVDASSLETAILNLVLNARAAMPNGGRLVIETSTKRIQDGIVTEDRVLPAGNDMRPKFPPVIGRAQDGVDARYGR